MDWVYDFVTNPFLLTSLSGWCVAQVLKVIINAVVFKKFDWRRLFGWRKWASTNITSRRTALLK